ncbi:hypothetical protein [Weissella fangxianensis]|uniref:hypothetical protein n=1 Tax=Weissella fangxianensis TaxID=2953879 RepID=UPI0021572FA3|nr:hypothetical protein [Weissella fangxianensis]
MNILYLYLHSSLERERKKYESISKLGVSTQEIKSLITKELAILIYTPVTFAIILLFLVLFTMTSIVSSVDPQMLIVGIVITLSLLTIGFVVIRKVYLNKLLSFDK